MSAAGLEDCREETWLLPVPPPGQFDVRTRFFSTSPIPRADVEMALSKNIELVKYL
jgi:hypothetical protein